MTMKHLFLGLIASSVLALTACNGNPEKKAVSTEQATNQTAKKVHSANNEE